MLTCPLNEDPYLMSLNSENRVYMGIRFSLFMLQNIDHEYGHYFPLAPFTYRVTDEAFIAKS